MSAVPFDTLKYLETLKEAGIPENQARALTTGLTEAVDMNLATKQDIKDLKNELILKLGAICVVAIGVSITLMEFLRT